MKVKRDKINKNKYTLRSVKGDRSVKYIDKHMLSLAGFVRDGLKYVNEFNMWICDTYYRTYNIFISGIFVGDLTYAYNNQNKAIITFSYDTPQKMHDYVIKELENIFSQKTQREVNQEILNDRFK